MKIHRLFPLLVALLGLTGCDEGQCFVGSVPPDSTEPGMILVGEETRLRLTPNFMGSCEPVSASPTSLSAEVYDPDNQPVAHQSSLGAPDSFVSDVRFTASKAGRHHVFVAFDPVGGIHQMDLYAAADRSKEAQLLSLQQTCSALERTRKGTLVCDQYVLRNGTVEQRFTNSLLAVVGDVVWVVGAQSVQRYVDSGTALTLTGTLEHIAGPPGALHASENDLVVVYASVIQYFTSSGTGLATTGTAAWTPSINLIANSGGRVLALRQGDRLGLVTRTSAGSTNIPSYQVCPHRLENGRFLRTAEACSSFTGVVVGYEPNALWVGDPRFFTEQDFTSLRYLEWTETRLAEQASLPLGRNLKLTSHPFFGRLTVVPTITTSLSAIHPRSRSAVAVYSADRRAILLEHLDAELLEPAASRHLLWTTQTAGSPTGSIRIRVRP